MLLSKLLHCDGVKVSSQVFHTLAAVEVYKISHVKMCQLLEYKRGIYHIHC